MLLLLKEEKIVAIRRPLLLAGANTTTLIRMAFLFPNCSFYFPFQHSTNLLSAPF